MKKKTLLSFPFQWRTQQRDKVFSSNPSNRIHPTTRRRCPRPLLARLPPLRPRRLTLQSAQLQPPLQTNSAKNLVESDLLLSQTHTQTMTLLSKPLSPRRTRPASAQPRRRPSETRTPQTFPPPLKSLLRQTHRPRQPLSLSLPCVNP